MTNKEIIKKYVIKIKSSVRLWSDDYESGLDRDIEANLKAYANEVKQEQPTEEHIRKEADSRSKKYPTESTKAAYSLGFLYGCWWMKDEINNK